ncbi:MAG TPA: zinc ribbon domain-containing protein [Chloroflexia bacterium]|nr:zinc ribbon domain-containing protein [Chloroflexia bacterium]
MTNSATIFCKRCGTKNARDLQFCTQCSAPLHDAPGPAPAPAGAAPLEASAPPAPVAAPGNFIFCKRCGAKNPRDSQYCDQCSAPLHLAGPGSVSAPPAPPSDALRPGALGVSNVPPAAAPPPGVVTRGPAPPAAPAPSSESIIAVPGLPAPFAPPPRGAKARRGGPPFLLIGGAILALLIFLAVAFGGFLLSSGGDLQTSIGTAVAQQSTVQAEQGLQIRVALTELANSGGSLAAQQTAIVQATAADRAAQATTTAVIAEVATFAVERQAAKDEKGPGGEPVVVVPVVFPPPAARIFLTPLPLPAPITFANAPGTSPDAAVAVAVPVTITNKITVPDEVHWYKIDLTKYSGGSLSLKFSTPKSAENPMGVDVYDEAGVNEQLNGPWTLPATTQETLFVAKPAVYTLKVSTAGHTVDATDPYRLEVTFHPNGSNADKDHAPHLGLVGAVQGYLSSKSDSQWFLVDMSAFPQGGKYTAALTVPPAAKDPYNIILHDASGANQVDARSVLAGQNNQVSVEPKTGTNYLLEINSDGGFAPNDPYVIGTYFLPHSANGTPGQAREITPPVLAKVHIAAPQDVVYFSFKVNGPSTAQVKITTPADGSHISVEFTDANDQQNYGYHELGPGQQADGMGYFRNPGTYLMKVYGSGGDAVSLAPATLDLHVDPTK